MKACKDCKHYQKDGECVSPRAYQHTNLITGEKERDFCYAKSQRSLGLFFSWFFGLCGSSGRWFEAKDEV